PLAQAGTGQASDETPTTASSAFRQNRGSRRPSVRAWPDAGLRTDASTHADVTSSSHTDTAYARTKARSTSNCANVPGGCSRSVTCPQTESEIAATTLTPGASTPVARTPRWIPESDISTPYGDVW